MRTRSLAALGMKDAGLWARSTTFGLLLATLLGSPALAQVGHTPSSSPYRDIFKGHTVTAIGGYIGGDGGTFGIGPHDGPVYGIRYDVRTASATQIGLQVSQGDLQRVIVDPFVQVANRVSGPVDQRVTFVEADLQFNLTGGKTWHRLAPYLGAAVGVTFASEPAADTSGYEFGNKVYFAPQAGVRIFVAPRLHLRGDARVAFWKMKYPTSFTEEPPLEPGVPPNSNAVITDGNVSEWIVEPWFQAGLGYSFTL
jgi:hypothetical protein